MKWEVLALVDRNALVQLRAALRPLARGRTVHREARIELSDQGPRWTSARIQGVSAGEDRGGSLRSDRAHRAAVRAHARVAFVASRRYGDRAEGTGRRDQAPAPEESGAHRMTSATEARATRMNSSGLDSEERLRAVSRILARGILRLRRRQMAASRELSETRDTGLDLSRVESVHARNTFPIGERAENES